MSDWWSGFIIGAIVGFAIPAALILAAMVNMALREKPPETRLPKRYPWDAA